MTPWPKVKEQRYNHHNGGPAALFVAFHKLVVAIRCQMCTDLWFGIDHLQCKYYQYISAF